MMRGKRLYMAAVIFPILTLAGWVGFLQYSLWHQPRVQIAVSGYDPRNLLSGHYLSLQLDWDKTDCRQFSGAVCPQERFRDRYVYYVPETDARALERLIAEGKHRIELRFAFPAEGEPRIVDLWLDGEPWQNKLTKQEKTHTKTAP